MRYLAGERKHVEFLVTFDSTIPIIGCPILAELEISVDLWVMLERIVKDD